MKRQVTRLAIHQNAKVFAVLMTLTSAVIFVPIMLIGMMFSPQGQRPSFLMMVLMPVFYLVFTYLSTAVGAWLYNLVAGWVGGFEFDAEDVPDVL